MNDNSNLDLKPVPGNVRLRLATGSYTLLCGNQQTDANPVVYPSYGIARVEAHLRTLEAIELASKHRLAVPYSHEFKLVRQRCADDLEAWALHGFRGEIEPMFSAPTRAVHPQMLKRAGIGAARYLLAGEPNERIASQPAPFHALYDELLSEYVRTNLSGLSRDVADARVLLSDWMHGKAIRALAARYPEFHYQTVEVAVPQQQCSRASVASISTKIKQLLSWYVGSDTSEIPRNFSSKEDWRMLMASSEFLPGIAANKLKTETQQLLQAANIISGIDCERRHDREKLQQAALHWAQWGLWSQQLVNR